MLLASPVVTYQCFEVSSYYFIKAMAYLHIVTIKMTPASYVATVKVVYLNGAVW